MKIPFKIHYTTYFLILTFLFTGYIKNVILIYMIILFHEFGHIFIIKILKYKIEKVEIYPMGGITSIHKKINSSLIHDLFISVFGILFQVILAFLFFIFFQYGFITYHTYNLFQSYNKTIMIFNMIPIIPLDGYQFLRAIMEFIFPYKKSFYLSFIISVIASILFITYHEIHSLNNYLMISFLIYKMITTYKDFKYFHFRFLMERHLYQISYHKIKYEKKNTLDILKKDTYHYFKDKNRVYSEKRFLSKKFENR